MLRRRVQLLSVLRHPDSGVLRSQESARPVRGKGTKVKAEGAGCVSVDGNVEVTAAHRWESGVARWCDAC